MRLLVGLAAAGLTPGTYGWSNLAALLLILSNFLDHTDGELARISGKSSRIGHIYDLASDALVTILLFWPWASAWQPGAGIMLRLPPALLGLVAGVAVALIFCLRMRIEDMAGKTGEPAGLAGGFETEDVLYLLPLVTSATGSTPLSGRGLDRRAAVRRLGGLRLPPRTARPVAAGTRQPRRAVRAAAGDAAPLDAAWTRASPRWMRNAAPRVRRAGRISLS